mmetsp:Transcript_55051/g.63539  ORF Transcript_55051/g.63539 Transcript_55051/m.63539 type:complete len:174 (+) Transcript_55051:650-1171(+)
MHKHVHHFYPEENQADDAAPIPTIVLYCTIGYRSGREAQRLVDDLTSTFGIDIGTSVEIKQLDGILSYSFVEDAPPLPSHTQEGGGSDDVMTRRRIHSYGNELMVHCHPSGVRCDLFQFQHLGMLYTSLSKRCHVGRTENTTSILEINYHEEEVDNRNYLRSKQHKYMPFGWW